MQLFLYAGIVLVSASAFGQSTLGTILGTVKDQSGAVVRDGSVTVTNTDENTSRKVTTDANGDYQAINEKPGHYSVEVSAGGFDTSKTTDLTLDARQELRVDVTMQVGRISQAVEVEGAAGVITTDSDTVSSTYDELRIENLPANFRASASPTPYNLIASLPGVQTDSSGNYSIQGGIPSQSQFTVDGISITDTTGNSPLRMAFPSTEDISEIRVQGVGSPAEYGQPGDVTVISKSGSNTFHGNAFWYFQNRDFDATAYGQTVKPAKVANDFGGTISGPVLIPHLYNGHDKTFFFADGEGFEFPRGLTVQNEVPTANMRNGDFAGSGITILDPTTGKPYANDTIPSGLMNPIAQKILSLYPVPNTGNPDVLASNNYTKNANANYNLSQFDVRGDHYINSKNSVFARFTWKDINQNSPQELSLPSEVDYENVRMLVVSWNYTISPAILNEFRIGYTIDNNGNSWPYDGPSFTNSLGLQGLGGLSLFNGLPEIDFPDITSLNIDHASGNSESRTFQINDNLSNVHGRHTMKYGFDVSLIRAVSPLGFEGADNYGTFAFEDSVFTGNAFANFLLGLPAESYLDNVEINNDGRSKRFALFGQDSWKVNDHLTIDLGLRYELNPGYTDENGDIGNFNPAVAKSGEVIYPDGAQKLLATGFLASANACMPYGSTTGPTVNGAPCMPVLDNSQAGLPPSLREWSKLRFMPRFGFAWRPFNDEKTVVRGGFGIYNDPGMGSIYYALTGTIQAAVNNYSNISPTGAPIFQWPATNTGGNGYGAPAYGTDYFGTANQINWKDPYSMQWSFSIERELTRSTGLRLSYIGMGTRDLVWSPDLNQLYYSTTFAVDEPRSAFPFPNWGTVNTRASGATANYESAQLELNHRYSSGLTLDSAFTFAHNLADNQGTNCTSFADENSCSRSTDVYDLKQEYGNVYGTPRMRWITTAVYDLPFGHGRTWFSSANGLANAVIGGWRLDSIFLIQTGPFITPYFSSGDPSGTGSYVFDGRAQPADLVGNPVPTNQNRNNWINANAFACPGEPGVLAGPNCNIGVDPATDPAPIGRFGTEGIGIMNGPGTVNLSVGLAKFFNITERVRLKAEMSFTNVFNHTNLADPDLNMSDSSFGTITSARGTLTGADLGGNRTGQASMRLEF